VSANVSWKTRKTVQSIDLVAWWGAGLATVVFAWDVAKWLRDGPRLRTRVLVNTAYLDGRILSVEQLADGKREEMAMYCHLEVVNAGTLPTTIMGISATHSDRDRKGQMSITGQRFISHHGKVLPHVLAPGEVWSCRLEMTDLRNLAERGDPYIDVVVSHRRKPVVIRPKFS
jgi:hypothetical protein